MKIWNILKMGRRGLAEWSGMVSGVVVLLITAVVGALIIQNVQTTTTAGSGARNISDAGLSLFNNFGSLLPILGTVLVAAIVIGVVYMFARRA